MTSVFITVTLVITGCLFVLNVVFAIAFRRRRIGEVLSYIVAGLIELAVFVVSLALLTGMLTSIPYHLPPGLVFNRAQIAAALALGIGLFPAAYWHRTTLGQLRARMEQDAKVMKERDGGVRVKAPGEWIN